MDYPISTNQVDYIDLAKWGINASNRLVILRTDLNCINSNHPYSQLLNGNKLYKLKYNINHLKKNKKKGILTFGGPYSNHLYATAVAGQIFNFKTIGIVRGEEWKKKNNPTLNFCSSSGMELKYWSRTKYRQKSQSAIVEQLLKDNPHYLIVPEGGSNNLALKGTKEILDSSTLDFEVICLPVGTGGTLSGMYLTKQLQQQMIGFASVAMPYEPLISNMLAKENVIIKSDLIINYDYTFGGFAKFNNALIEFINRFKAIYDIQLEPLYTGKMLFGIFKMIVDGVFKVNEKILAIHTGGLQGIKGFNLQNENCLIDI